MQFLGRVPAVRTLRRLGVAGAAGTLSRSEKATLLAAEQARDEARWGEATTLFERVAVACPERHDLRIQIGNCAKEDGLYRAAYDALRSVLGTELRRDAELQIGHLFKVTGNFRAARAAFRRASALGDPEAAQEVAAYGPAWLGTARLARAAPRGEHALAADELRDLLAQDLAPDPPASSTRALADLSFALGELTLAKAFHELAYLSSDSPSRRSAQIDLALRTGLWPPDHVLALRQADRALWGGASADPRETLRALLSAAAPPLAGASFAAADDEGPGARPATETAGPAATPSLAAQSLAATFVATKFLADAAPAPMALDTRAAEHLLALLAEGLARVHAAFSHYRGGDPSALIAAVAALRQHLRPAGSHVAFALAGTLESYRLHATRLLHDRVADWVRHVEDAYLGPRAAPALIGRSLATGGHAVAARLAAEAPGALFDASSATLAELRIPQTEQDRALARLMTLAGPELALDQVRRLIDEALRRHAFATAVALIERQMAFDDVDVVEIASRFKQAGEARHALALLERHLDEAGAGFSARIEKALIAKTAGDFTTAARLLEACAAEQPDNEFVRCELVAVLPELEPVEGILARYRGDALFLRLARERQAYRLAAGAPEAGHRIGMTPVAPDVRVVDLAPEIATEFLPPPGTGDPEGIHDLRVGWKTRRGPGLGETRPLLRCHDFVRVRTAFADPITRLRVRVDGRTVGVTDGVDLPARAVPGRLQAKMFNCWIDLSGVPEGLHELQLYFEEPGGGYRTHEQSVWVDPTPPARTDFASAAAVDLSGDTAPGTLEERIARQPSAVFPAARRLLEPPRRILVMRVDQLGDLITSIPAMLRLREAFPEAELSCLVSPNYVFLMEELGIFADIFTLDFPYEQSVGKRHVTLAQQAELRRRLGARDFDIAIDLCFGHMSRPLLHLAQARFTVGFWPQEFPWLDFGMDVRSRDIVTGRYRLPQQAVANMLIDGLIALSRHASLAKPHAELDWPALADVGIVCERPFVLLHTGGRTRSRKWSVPHFTRLAELLVERAGEQVIMVADDPADVDAACRARLTAADVRLIEHRLPFATLDMLLSAAAVFVGNDSGPKHLAAFRGTPVVSIHGGPINWSEWGQDGTGCIIAHRVPCSGCGIELVEECGKGLACLENITPETVFEAVRAERAGRALSRSGLPAL